MKKSLKEMAEKVAFSIANEIYDDIQEYLDHVPDWEKLATPIIKKALLTIQNEMKEECAKIVEDRMIYTGPGGIDPEPIQKKLAQAIRSKIEKKND